MAGIGYPTIELEKVSNAQNACFWKGVATHEGLEITWGIAGTNGNRKFIRISDCLKSNPAYDLEQRIEKKLLGAYNLKSFSDEMRTL